jgi:hypothetical protein
VLVLLLVLFSVVGAAEREIKVFLCAFLCQGRILSCDGRLLPLCLLVATRKGWLLKLLLSVVVLAASCLLSFCPFVCSSFLPFY